MSRAGLQTRRRSAVGVTFVLSEPGVDAARPVRLWPAAIIIIGVTLAVWAVARAIDRSPADEDHDAPADDDQADGPLP